MVKAPQPSPLRTFGPLVLATLSLIDAGAVMLGGESEPKASAVPSSPPPAHAEAAPAVEAAPVAEAGSPATASQPVGTEPEPSVAELIPPPKRHR